MKSPASRRQSRDVDPRRQCSCGAVAAVRCDPRRCHSPRSTLEKAEITSGETIEPWRVSEETISSLFLGGPLC